MSRYAVYLDHFGPLGPPRRPPTIPPLDEYLAEVLGPLEADGIAAAAGAGPLASDMREAIAQHWDTLLGGSRL